tara:strand:- start:117 stop:3761 length:3645 start_codon:yes stop_codon:yes gene_type:complete
MASLFDRMSSDPVLEEQETVIEPTTSAIPTARKSSLFERMQTENVEEPEAVTTRNRETIEKNTAVRGAAQRFVRDRLGMTDLSEEEAMEEFVEHFRKFNVNEMTAAGDFNYVSGIAADATGKTNLDTKRRDEAKQRLSDYQLLYTAFQDLPSFHGGGWETFFDYAEGIMKSPSTYIGLALPGAGKAGGVAANTAAKAATQSVLMTALKTVAPSNVIKQAAARPLRTAAGVEAFGALTQDMAAQNTEIEANLRDEYSFGQSLTAAAVGAALPAAVGLYGLKGAVRKGVERNTGDLLGDAQKAIIEKNELAEAAADKILKENDIIAKDLKSVLAGLDPDNKIKPKKKEKPADKRALPEEQVEAGQEKFADIAEDMGVGTGGDASGVARTIGVEPEAMSVTPEFVLSFDPSRNKRVFAAVTELIKKGKIDIDIASDPSKRVTEYVSDAIRKFAKDDPDKAAKLFEDLAEKYNLTGDDFANLFIADISDAARKLQGASAASRIFKRLNGVAGDDIFYLDTQTKELIQKATDDITKGDNRAAFQFLTEAERRASKKSGKSLMDHLQRADELRRSAMTSQVATTIRNTASGAARVGIDVVTKGFDRGLAKFVHGATGGKFGSKAGGLAAPNEDVFAILMGLMNKKETDAVETLFKEGFSKKSAQLFREMQDVLDSAIPDSARTSKLRILGKELNALNTASDNLFKRAAFVGNLKRGLNELAAKGEKVGKLDATDLNLRNIIRQGNFNAVFNTPQGKKILDKAIDESLYFTYQRTPDNQTARQMIRLAHSAPFLTSSLVPFPRFIANALRFTYEYSPMYILSDVWGRGAISKTFRDGGAENFEEISKALVGTAGLYGAMAFRESEYAGEKWYEGRLPDGTTFDMRPFFPAAPYLWAADLYNRYQKAKDDPMADPVIGESSFFTEGLQALSGTQFRAGFGIYAIDGAIEDWLGAKDNPEALQKIGINMAANVASTYSIPLTVGQDLYNTFLSPDDERIVRDTKSSDMTSLFVNKALARVPGNYAIEKMLAESMGTTAPEIYESPTRAGVLRRTTPLSRQYIGILKQERKNWFEKEIDTLKIGRRIIARKTGIPEADILLNQHFGEYIEDYVTPTLKNSEDYKKMTAAEKRNMMVNVIGHYKQDIEDLAKRKARASDDAMLSRFGFNPIKALDFKNLSKFARENALNRYHELHGVPDDSTKGYNYDELIYYGKFYEEQGKKSR